MDNSEVNIFLDCMVQTADPLEIVKASTRRDWMDKTDRRFAYRCTPLTIANGAGWELLCPEDFTVGWNGGNKQGDMYIVRSGQRGFPHYLSNAFGHGILTIHPGYLFKTPPGWNLMVKGAPNTVKDGIQALEGIVETNWMPFSFTMNWKMTRSGKVSFKKGEPLVFISPHPTLLLEDFQPRIVDRESDPETTREYDAWVASRVKHNEWLRSGAHIPPEYSWQRYYLQGKSPTGKSEAGGDHRTKLSLSQPTDDRKNLT